MRGRISMFALIISSMVSVVLLAGSLLWQRQIALEQKQFVTPTVASPAKTQVHHIVFASVGHDIFTVDADGKNLSNISQHPAQDDDPAWSPDGTRIAFTSNRMGTSDIYTMRPNGTQVTRLTTQPGENSNPVWSPDARYIAFRHSDGGSDHDLCIMTSDGKYIQQITTGEVVWEIAWAPDSTRLAFSTFKYSSAGEQQEDLYFVQANGNGLHHMTTGIQPTWSPDGTQLLFTHQKQIYRMNADGTGLAPLVSASEPRPYTYEHPAWSPDGTQIAFISTLQIRPNRSVDIPANIWVMNADGTHMHRLTDTIDFTEPGMPQWSPDSHKLLFSRRWGASIEDIRLYVMNADGTDVHSIGMGRGAEWKPQ